MSEESEYDSVADRIKSAQPRVHSDLTEIARERIAVITANPARVKTSNQYHLPEERIDFAIRETFETVGVSNVKETYEEKWNSYQKHDAIINEADRVSVLTYIENLFESVHYGGHLSWKDVGLPRHDKEHDILYVRSRLEETVEMINVALETEGILWELGKENEEYNFYPIGSELMQESDQELSVIAQGKNGKVLFHHIMKPTIST